MDNPEYKILLIENSEQKNGFLWSLKEEGEAIVGKELTPWKGHICFSLKDLELRQSITAGSSFDEETGKNKEEDEENEVIVAGFLFDECWNFETLYKHNHKPSMFGTHNEIDNAVLYIRKGSEISDNHTTCSLKGAVHDEYSYIIIEINLKPKQFNFIAELIRVNRLEGLELLILDPSGFYSAPDEDYIKVLTDSKMHKIETPDNCKIIPPRLGRGYFSIRAVRRDILKLNCEKNELDDEENGFEENDDSQENKKNFENILNQLNRMEGKIAFPIWVILLLLVFIVMEPWRLKVLSLVKEYFSYLFS